MIDKFIIKEENGLEEKLFEVINNFKEIYFQEFSEILLQVFDKGIKKTIQYNLIFSNWYDKNKISEYYQLNSNGSCLGFDEKGKIYWLLISSNKKLLEYIEIAENSDEVSPGLKDLKSNKKLLFFLTEEDKQISPSSWKKRMFPIHYNFIVDNEKYFYSFVSGKIY